MPRKQSTPPPAPVSSKAKDTPPKGIRVSLKGLRTMRDLRAMLHEAVDSIEALGITHARGINLYLTPSDAKGGPVTRIGRRKIEDIVIENPYRSAAEEFGL